jgi:hypothetical protein
MASPAAERKASSPKRAINIGCGEKCNIGCKKLVR